MKVMGRAGDRGRTVATAPSPIEGIHASWGQRARSLVLGPHGGGTTRRRASDAVRVGLAVALIVIFVALADANTSFEIHVAQLLTPPRPASAG